MDTSAIPQSQIPHTSRLFQDYLYNYPRTREFFPFPPFAPESFAKAAQALRYPDALRAAFLKVFREQNERYGSGPESIRNLERFAKSGCCAVVTGQQIGLFTGPAFAIYKALTAIKLARTLSDQGLQAVPVFWLATEDHDLAEVTHCFVQDRGGSPRRLEYPAVPPVPNAPAGSVLLTEEILPLIDSLRNLLPDTPSGTELADWVAASYRPGASLGEAFGSLITRLFKSYGVLLVDPLDARMHRLSRKVFQVAIQSASDIHEDLAGRNRRLTEAGYHTQVRVAENHSTLFLYEGGQRTALRMEDGRFISSLGCTYQPEELLAMLEHHPEAFSPNVLLRPVMQDALLPTVAYVGGPSELAYLAQAAPLYDRMLGRMPVVFPRGNFTVLDHGSNRLLGKYELTLTDVFVGRQTLREKMAMRFLPEGLAGLFEKAASNLDVDLEAIKKSLEKLDPTLVDAASHSVQKMRYQLSHLERKAAAAVQHRSDQVEKDALRLENNLFPEKTLQERLYSGLSLLARFGLPLLDQLYEQIPLDSGDHQIIHP
ncbi:MAG: bacillithiol biosynthesis cysteine-adding enzyme BshC [Acidobacteria bacterium]|nr:bacillithiol biosynthesis cysteine-adding enzyme BshC [Acidobacteriota bacterium]